MGHDLVTVSEHKAKQTATDQKLREKPWMKKKKKHISLPLAYQNYFLWLAHHNLVLKKKCFYFSCKHLERLKEYIQKSMAG